MKAYYKADCFVATKEWLQELDPRGGHGQLLL
jgi:hypothetical protein